MCTRKKPLYFPLFLKLFESFSLFTSRHRKIRQKEAFIFLFVQSPLLFHFFFFKKNIFPIFFTFIAVVFVHFFLSSFCSSLFAVLPFFFSLFSPSLLFSLSQCFSSSFFFNLMFPCLFFHRRFVYLLLDWLILLLSFVLDLIPLFFLIFSSFPYPFFDVKPNTKNSPFFRRRLFFEPSLLLCFISCFSSLRRPYSLSVPCFLDFWAVLEITFLDFLFIYLLFESLQNIVVVFGHNFQKISLILVRKSSLGKNPCFRDFDIFLLLICFFVFHAWSAIFPFFVFFVQISWFLFVFISLFLLKKNTSKNKLILFIFVFTLLVLTLPELLSLVVFILSFFSVPFVLFCLFMFPLLMFNCSPYVYLFSLMFLLFVFILFFLTLFIPFLRPFFSNSFVSSFFFWFFNLVLSNKDFFFEKVSLKTLNSEKTFFLFYLQKIATEIAGATNNIVQISFVVTSTCFEQVSRCQAFSEKFFKKSSPSCVFFIEILSSQYSPCKKNCFFEKTSFYLLLIFFTISIVFWRGKEEGNLVNFQLSKKNCCVFRHVFHDKKFTFFLFSFPFFFSFSCPFFSLGHGDHMADDKTRHPEKRVKPMVGMVTKVWKKSFVGVFLSMTESRSWWTRVNQGDCVRPLDILGKGSAIVCFWWLTDLSGTPASEGLSSCSQTSNVRRRSWTKRIKWYVSKIRSCARKTKKCGKATQWIGRGNKQTGR